MEIFPDREPPAPKVKNPEKTYFIDTDRNVIVDQQAERKWKYQKADLDILVNQIREKYQIPVSDKTVIEGIFLDADVNEERDFVNKYLHCSAKK